MTVQPAPETLRGERGTYRLFDWVGGGGFGSVFFGRELSTNRAVALKRLHAHFVHDPRIVARFEREADLVLVHGLRHPNLVQILDRGRDEQDVPFLAMEWIDGRTLADLVTEHDAPFSITDAAAVGCQVLQGLAAAHALAIVHRDIKPSNLMVTASGRVIVMDLGIARSMDADGIALTGAYSAVPATLQYAAPEQLSGDRPVDGRTDLYALGATLYLLLAGQPPFKGPARPDPTPLEQLRPESGGGLADVVTRSLAFEPDDRFASATAMFTALRPFAPADLRVAVPMSGAELASVSVSASGSAPRAAAVPASGPRVTLLVVGAVLIVVALGLVGVALAFGRPAAPQPSATATVPALTDLAAPAAWPVLKSDLSDMSYTGDDAFASWNSTFASGILQYQLTGKTGGAYPVPIKGNDVGQTFHYAVSAKQTSGPPTASYGLLVGYPFGAQAADPSTSYYEFVIDNKTEARFAVRKDGVWKTLWQSYALSAVKPNDSNAFVVHAESVADGTQFTLFLNGRHLADLVDNQVPRSGATGVMLVLDAPGDTATWEFSDLELRAPAGSP